MQRSVGRWTLLLAQNNFFLFKNLTKNKTIALFFKFTSHCVSVAYIIIEHIPYYCRDTWTRGKWAANTKWIIRSKYNTHSSLPQKFFSDHWVTHTYDQNLYCVLMQLYGSLSNTFLVPISLKRQSGASYNTVPVLPSTKKGFTIY